MNTNSIYFSGNPNILPQLTLANSVHVPAPNHHFRRKPTEFILYSIWDGLMILQEDDQIYTLSTGDFILLDPSRTHVGHASNHTVHYSFVHFNWKEFQEISLEQEEYEQRLSDQRFDNLYHALECSQADCQRIILPKYFHLDHPRFQKLQEFMVPLMHNDSHMLEFQNTLNSCELLTLLVQIQRSQADSLLSSTPDLDQQLQDVLHYLETNYASKITGEEVSLLFSSNFDYLNRKFKSHIGMPIFQYLNQYRIRQSQQLLHTGMYSNAQIAEMTGFCSEFYFSRVFKKITGETPTSFRRHGIHQ